MRRPAGQVAVHAALATGALFILGPLVLMTIAAFQPPREVLEGELIPRGVTFQNFAAVFDQIPLGRFYLNGLIVAGCTFALQVLVCLPAAYALARLRFAGSGIVLWLVLLSLMILTQVIAIPVYLGFSRTGLLDTYPSLILPFVGSAFGIYLLRQFLLTVPQAVFDAARLDGAGPLRTITLVALPLVRPALVSFGVFSVVAHWNEYFWPSIVLQGTERATVPFGVVAFANTEAGQQFGPLMAMALLATLPMIVGFLLAQRHFIQGVALSGLQE